MKEKLPLSPHLQIYKPQITSPDLFNVDENIQSIGFIEAYDNDASLAFSTITYSIAGNGNGQDNGTFKLNGTTGELSWSDPSGRDYDVGDINTYQVMIQAYDGFNADTQVIIVNVNNLNDELPVIDNIENRPITENSDPELTFIQYLIKKYYFF